VVGRALFNSDGHRNLLLEDFGRGQMVQANQHLIIHDGMGLLLDPGGHKTFKGALAEVTRELAQGQLDYLFCSHQDPDVVAALNGWLASTDAEVLISSLWQRFIPHFGIEEMMAERLLSIPDEGMVIHLGDAPLVVLPAHFLHSCGNFQLYDPTARILYSGDLGASLGVDYAEVDDFTRHIPYMESFHRRYMGSNALMRAWAQMARQLDIEIIAPQHGAHFVGRQMVEQLIGWCETLVCGADLFASRLIVPSY